MNIFALDLDPEKAAQAHCDSHVVKMIVETAQILSTVWHQLTPPGAAYAIPSPAYKPTHKHHPCVIWAGAAIENYRWLWRLGSHLGEEFTYRYHHRHKSMEIINALSEPPSTIPKFGHVRGDGTCLPLGLQPFALAMPEEFQLVAEEYLTSIIPDSGHKPADSWLVHDRLLAAVAAYREYYICAKAHLLTYTNREPPSWIPDDIVVRKD